MTESLGFQTQAVGEFMGANSTSAPAIGSGMMHIMMFGGQNCGLIARGDVQGQHRSENTSLPLKGNNATRTRVVGFTGSNDVDWRGVNANGGTVKFEDEYAYWRLVSQGLRLNLLNSVEEDDGWWEAVRCKEPMNTLDWALMTRGSSTDQEKGCLVPANLLSQSEYLDFVNENSYSTGLLRDLHKHTFTLNPILDRHDFEQQMEDLKLDTDDCGTEYVGNNGDMLTFNGGEHGAQRLINQTVDKGYDIIYIRIHGRAAGSPTRLHYNITSNQEVVFPTMGRESRFQTSTAHVGNMNDHSSARGQQNASAHTIPVGM